MPHKIEKKLSLRPMWILSLACLSLILVLALRQVFLKRPDLVETLFIPHLTPIFLALTNALWGWLPFSVAEVFIFATLTTLLSWLIHWVYLLTKRPYHRSLRALSLPLSLLILGYCLFMVTWGFNYQRPPLSTRAGLSTEPRQLEALEALVIGLIDDANKQRAALNHGPYDLALPGLSQTLTSLMHDFSRGDLGQRLGLIQGSFAPVKVVFFSEGMSYLGITGIYMPFTGEANVNGHSPRFLLPATMAHELAHQRGIAAEDEANFVAYLATQEAKDPKIQYSGTVMALIHAINALYDKAPERARALREGYGQGLRGDFEINRAYWMAYEGQVSKVHNQVNDAYLKSNNQASGVASYGQMVDLLLAYRAQGKK